MHYLSLLLSGFWENQKFPEAALSLSCYKFVLDSGEKMFGDISQHKFNISLTSFRVVDTKILAIYGLGSAGAAVPVS